MNHRVAVAGGCLAASLALIGCKSTVDQQLLERELRLQEDQIYQLQDELASRQATLQRTEVENATLRKQLGFSDGDPSLPRRGGGSSPAVNGGGTAPLPVPSVSAPDLPVIVAPPVIMPPAGAAPPPAGGSLRFGPPSSPPGAMPPAAVPGGVAPPTLDGVPPLPSGSSLPAAPAGRTSASGPLTLPPIRRLSHEETVAAQGAIAALVVNPSQTTCFDHNGDGISEGLSLVVEPRDAADRLVAAGGELVIAVFDESVAPVVVPAGGAQAAAATAAPPPAEACLARWTIPEAEANGRFRSTSRARGLHFMLGWPGRVPQADHVRVLVTLSTADGRSFEADALVATR